MQIALLCEPRLPSLQLFSLHHTQLIENRGEISRFELTSFLKNIIVSPPSRSV
jgi:hypothetical protein